METISREVPTQENPNMISKSPSIERDTEPRQTTIETYAIRNIKLKGPVKHRLRPIVLIIEILMAITKIKRSAINGWMSSQLLFKFAIVLTINAVIIVFGGLLILASPSKPSSSDINNIILSMILFSLTALISSLIAFWAGHKYINRH